MQTKKLTLLFLRDKDRVLLAMKKRGFGTGRWNGVGGKVEEGETIAQALLRETSEEINIIPTRYEQVGDIVFDEFLKGVRTYMHVHIFIAHAWDGEPSESDEMRPQWFNVDQLPYETMWPDDPYWLPQILEGKKIQAQFTLDEHDVITRHDVKEVSGFSH